MNNQENTNLVAVDLMVTNLIKIYTDNNAI